MKSAEYCKALKSGREVVIMAMSNKSRELTTIFWMDGNMIYSWNREFGMVDREDMTLERFAQHCDKMRESGHAVAIRG